MSTVVLRWIHLSKPLRRGFSDREPGTPRPSFWCVLLRALSAFNV